ncbi:quinohemoprotein amine dehydrogenase subunit alpha [Marinobacterium arenosum]|uniref:quinohemoprotein amine dehydrogenase subunit alpha n=1 Tax=Marinobacterium arenosum TaxID=2862496 RepID=UPI001C9514E2|nr:quinohemoprotein amine dehydrogenase subunit alpha [Marinobacterium arenosum]MBY4676630.1 quinohemoprotein amine dehydrogenase subunit alpha [Marinobacterium arenosum]
MALNNNKTKRALLGSGALALLGLAAVPLPAQALDGADIIRQRCLACHSETGDAAAPFSRISEQRKTPEGWMTTLNRMQSQRGLEISVEEKRALIKYLSDNQGLAPAETAEHRYLLEQTPNVVDNPAPAYAEMCARCHSGARFALQRRSEDEWRNLVHFHMGQFPTLEFHALSRDRAWFDIALNDTVPQLAKEFPLQSAAWQQWQQAEKPKLAGSWAVAGYLPGKGAFDGRLTVRDSGDDRYSVLIEGRYADGSPLSGGGSAVVYAGYEWRANLTVDGIKMRQVLAASEDGSRLRGRQFQRNANEIGGELTAVRADRPAILSVTPSYIKHGETRQITLAGSQLGGKLALGSGLELLKVIARSDSRVTLLVRADANTEVGMRTLRVGKATAELALYDALARVEITPDDSIARVGGNGGPIPKVRSSYRALGYAAGADGQPGTDDDLRLGYMPASWSLKPFDEIAEHDNDLKYAGTIDADGIFTPGDAGLNPERKMSTNNVGNLTVVGTVQDGDNAVSGEAHLLVTVQDFVKSPLQ